MSNLLDLSGKIDPRSLALFATFSDVAAPLGVAFFLVGATARDMIFEFGHGLPSKRATLDRDFGVRISSWAEFEKLKESLLTSGLFKETNEVQRLLFQDELRVDILPFGGIAGAQGEIRWPPDEDVVMSMVGFEDAYRAALEVRVRASPPLDILVASSPGLTILKLISWADRPHDRSRDAIDLAFILERYLDAGNNERLFEEHIDLVEVEDFDYVRAGARLLGRDLAKIGKPETIRRIKEILAKETAEEGQHGLIQDMMPVGSVFDKENGNRFDELLILLRALVKGINDR
ncbi:MAG: nucleotidyl transferase AbiEii/AbiGii toxin family protein [Terriglobia bacterium]